MLNRTSNTPTAPLSAEDRVRLILELVVEQGFQSVDSLAIRFGVSTQTIRRDVNALCDSRMCRRRHGGIDIFHDAENVHYSSRRILHHEAKLHIARCVAEAIPDGASLFFGIGTTPEECAQALVKRQGLRVMTNNINVALALTRNASCELTIAGGRLRNPDGDVVAGEAHGFFSRFSVDIGIYGVGGVAEDGSLLDFSHDEVRMRTELSSHCRERFLVLDHSKFGRRATVRGGHITDASCVFTDSPPPPHITDMLNERGIKLIVAQTLPLPSPAVFSQGEI
ncbi:DeoR/GlpR family DNA-binding transcription regulator [Herbaspirillum sp. RTI4]|uniref:DeoR/GlpR family DNA-binding transcription regulator n=1 Tax=Herbaspirillum sp. RTI4 TaxID=3048640 RepID=UPI002AB5B506|nr:DeoR/GlpR family DNA-binding transcription regulator [Herbaspirillum sp. RTI4]MDY7579391.1 DeoR/GlpR family DNA-binding transcription regulator [Herbaspirillum sp. RTI4]MEA9980305.1 DeoR/GlpR family DNA-binding transcription regulator [Herbaspirillum sp. RTI4]